MFGLFKSKSAIEHEKRVQLFYQNCKKEIEDYIADCPEPTREDILKIAVNAKLTHVLFGGVKQIQAEARQFIYPLTTNGLAVFISIDGMEEYAALEKMQALVKRTISTSLSRIIAPTLVCLLLILPLLCQSSSSLIEDLNSPMSRAATNASATSLHKLPLLVPSTLRAPVRLSVYALSVGISVGVTE